MRIIYIQKVKKLVVGLDPRQLLRSRGSRLLEKPATQRLNVGL